MASTYSSNLRLELMANGENSSTWGTKTNANLNMVEESISGYKSIALAGGVNYTLTTNNAATDDARQMVLRFTGTLSANINIICPTAEKVYCVVDDTTHGAYSLTFKTSGGTGIALVQGGAEFLHCDGTNVERCSTVAYMTSNGFYINGTQVTATAAELNLLDGAAAGLTTTEINYLDGVTSAIQTQINGKQASLTNIADTSGANGYGDRTVATTAPSGGNSGDIWCEVASTSSGWQEITKIHVKI